MPKVSVIIPSYNAIQYLPAAVASVQSQTFTDLEIIIINDGSADHTHEWVQQQQDPRIILLDQDNQGKSAARNHGIQKAQGDYLAFLDADDLWEPTKLEKQVHCLEQCHGIGLVYTWTALADQRGQLTGRLVSSCAEGQVWPQLVQGNVLGCGSTPMVRQVCFQSVGLFDIDLPLAQDWDMWIRIAAQYPFQVIREPLVRYRQHKGNTSANWQLMEQCRSRILEQAFATCDTEYVGLKQRAYDLSNLYLGWLAIRNQDHQQALQFWQQAISQSPQLLLSRQSLTLLTMSLLTWGIGTENLQKILQAMHTFRRYTST